MNVIKKIINNLESKAVYVKLVLKSKEKGAFTFEYIIVLVLMVAIIMAAWAILTPVIMQKVNDIANSVSNNGV